MLRIRLTAADFASVRFAPRPAPLQELNTAFLTLFRPDGAVLLARWRRRVLGALPPTAGALGEVVRRVRAPAFLDVFADSLPEALDEVRSARPELVRAELERVHAGRPAPPAWVRDLHRGDADAWRPLLRAQRSEG
ncbi:hypothetical protein [Streptantibioticus cattleyicolor]|uniref:Putative regulatory protein n=1 Tax=Streptantibioticus cattleyicolor (strain ATCC 35852 / DSM 46488 / JCM 4925 / NBRC 14057 / NRRL 8057) TaxID=1003195 RepID=F8JN93_STREN|nr:hypothetical protein [Streptantibioticus cattleyicolor]AEW99147.1 putative regulatory protein [Streptantibioticus cattleyicolor NRRL 8057 = DSM 46488]CCB71809.1 protein of unknown function [Streptantibioticus cattleyicolor NRRL 8057 = DSM 46488]